MYSLRLKDIREDSDIRQVDLANFLNCTQTCYSNWEIGARELPLKALVKLAEKFETSTDYILGITDVRNPYPKKKYPKNDSWS